MDDYLAIRAKDQPASPGGCTSPMSPSALLELARTLGMNDNRNLPTLSAVEWIQAAGCVNPQLSLRICGLRCVHTRHNRH
jgi:hypothetical protein